MTDEEWGEHCADMHRLIDQDLDLRSTCLAVLREEA